MPETYKEVVGQVQLNSPMRELVSDEIEVLWRVFCRIESIWKFPPMAGTLKSQWYDYILARSTSDSRRKSYLPEFINAALVASELYGADPTIADDLIFFKTLPTKLTDTSTRLEHAKFFVFNDFLRCFVMLGGFADFGGRNYRGYMGGSRYGDSAPIRTGART